jgi:hypothetical protein
VLAYSLGCPGNLAGLGPGLACSLGSPALAWAGLSMNWAVIGLG